MGHKVNALSTIYAIRCTVNGKIYVGRTQNLERRMREHLHDLRRGGKDQRRREGCGFQKDFDTHGEDSFKLYVLEKDVAPELLQAREAYWIDRYNSANPAYGYNCLSGKKPCSFEVIDGLPPVAVKP